MALSTLAVVGCSSADDSSSEPSQSTAADTRAPEVDDTTQGTASGPGDGETSEAAGETSSSGPGDGSSGDGSSGDGSSGDGSETGTSARPYGPCGNAGCSEPSEQCVALSGGAYCAPACAGIEDFSCPAALGASPLALCAATAPDGTHRCALVCTTGGMPCPGAMTCLDVGLGTDGICAWP